MGQYRGGVMSNWAGFKYVEVRGIIERVQRRALRAQRKALLRMFTERGQLPFMARTRALRDNSRLWCDRKIAQFQRIYDDYVKFVTRTTETAASEASSIPVEGVMGLSGA